MQPEQTKVSATSQIDRIWLVVSRILTALSALTLLTMMALTSTDVIARYIVNRPIRGAFEITELLLVCLVFLSMPLACRAGTHVEVELIEPKSLVMMKISSSFAHLCGFAIFAVLAWQIFDYAERFARYGQVTNSLEIPLSWPAYLASACCALSALVFVGLLFKTLGKTKHD
ncbi:MAG: TRAP transporter small permease [Cognatishimia sp.]